jgi:carbamoyl-phosphate synthase large subunit
MNVLVSSAGRRTSLVQAFARSAHGRGGAVIAADADALAPALYLADHAARVPVVTDARWQSTLLDVVGRHSVSMIVPTIDTELRVLSRSSQLLSQRACIALISEETLLDVCADKCETVRVFGGKGIRVPRSWLPEDAGASEIPDQVFVKPRDGSASQHTYRASIDELEQVLARVPNAIVQEALDAPEITIDALLDLDGRPIHYVPRLRIRTVGGESIQGVTIDDADIGEWIRFVLDVVSSLGGRGPVTLQAFLTPGEPTLSEINPRFGGGFPLALAAGADYPEWLLQMAEGARVRPRLGQYRRNLYMSRYYVERIVEEPKWCD